MAMRRRLDQQKAEALHRDAERKDPSMQQGARQEIREHIERTSKRERLDTVLDRELPRYAEALERLRQ
ncbi:MAG: hypothetical protein IRZ15_02005 [Bryobacteraceae bacterium]|nr:hypothetical protein [Bryobacteraceae bacterium]